MPAVTQIARFKSHLRKGTPAPADTVLRKDYVTSVADVDDRKVRFTISTATPDRENDVIAVDGWDLAAFKQNPVVLWQHDAYSLPIGRCVEIGSDGGKLVAVVEFLPADTPERGAFAEAVLRMCRTGFLSTTSVGFRPLEFEMATERMTDDDYWPPCDFHKQELLELPDVTARLERIGRVSVGPELAGCSARDAVAA